MNLTLSIDYSMSALVNTCASFPLYDCHLTPCLVDDRSVAVLCQCVCVCMCVVVSLTIVYLCCSIVL